MGSSLGRILMLPTAFLLSCSIAVGVAMEARDSLANTYIAPVSFPPDGSWDGIDGKWSSFELQVGTPGQAVRTFVSWASYQTWVVLPQGCSAATDVSTCTTMRGGTFTPADSSTWDRIGFYYLGIEDDLGYKGDGVFGYDTVQLGQTDVVLKNTTVGAFAVQDYYLGVFGLNPQPTNFTSLNEPSTSYMALLKDEGHIASLSFGYTAGAFYRGSGVFGSLTLGGYDSSKVIENDLEFALSSGDTRQTIVALKSISTESQVASNAAPIELLPGSVYVDLDATVSQIWLPAQACIAFEREFGLQFDSNTDLYLVNDTQHSALLQRNPNITFQLTGNVGDQQSISITLPYAAFDLSALPPYQGLTASTYYFPLRRASDPTRYTLGRTFFQEAYISVDFEGQVFNISQVNWSPTTPQNLVTIPPEDSTINGASHGLSSGELAGIGTGAIAIVVLIGLFFLWFYRHRTLARKKRSDGSEEEALNESEKNTNAVSERPAVGKVKVYPKVDPNMGEPALAPSVARARIPSGSSSPGKASSIGRPSPLSQAHHVKDSESFPTSVLDDRSSSFEVETRPSRLSALTLASMSPRMRSIRKPPVTQAPVDAANTSRGNEELQASKDQPRESTDQTRDLTALPRTSRDARSTKQSRVHWEEPEPESGDEPVEDEPGPDIQPPAIPPFAFEFNLQNEGRPF